MSFQIVVLILLLLLILRFYFPNYNAQIFNADNMLKPIQFKDTEIYSIYNRFLQYPEKIQKILFEE